jgi:hypothetical protein
MLITFLKMFVLSFGRNYSVLTSSNTVRKQVSAKITETGLKAACQNVCAAKNKEAVAHKRASIEYHFQCYSSEEHHLFTEYVVNLVLNIKYFSNNTKNPSHSTNIYFCLQIVSKVTSGRMNTVSPLPTCRAVTSLTTTSSQRLWWSSG